MSVWVMLRIVLYVMRDLIWLTNFAIGVVHRANTLMTLYLDASPAQQIVMSAMVLTKINVSVASHPKVYYKILVSTYALLNTLVKTKCVCFVMNSA